MAKIPVTLHIYHVSTDSRVGAINEYLEAMGTGAYHAGVEVNGKEWSYGYSPDNTGVFSCPPKGCKAHVYKDSLDMGETEKSKAEIESILDEMRGTWLGIDYDLLKKNCCIFSKELVDKLGVGPVPSWVTNLAAAGATLHQGILQGKEYADKAAIMAKAKAGEFDAKYDISGKTKAAAKDCCAMTTFCCILCCDVSEPFCDHLCRKSSKRLEGLMNSTKSGRGQCLQQLLGSCSRDI